MRSSRTLVLKDFDKDSFYLRALEHAVDVAEVEGLAVQTALAEHPVMQFVRALPVEDFGCNLPLSESYNLNENEAGKKEKSYIAWGLPTRGKPGKTCGFVTTGVHQGHLITSCSADHEHYTKAMKYRCWKLGCPDCANDTAIRAGVKAERKIVAHQYLRLQEHGVNIPPSHIVVSPPQKLTQELMQTTEGYRKLVSAVEMILNVSGIHAGAMVCHPWRQKSHGWEVGGHFHVVGFGRLKPTKKLKKMFPGWIFEKVHGQEKIRSVRQTFSYLLTHAGIARAEKANKDIDWDQKFLKHMISDKDVSPIDALEGEDEALIFKFEDLLARSSKIEHPWDIGDRMYQDPDMELLGSVDWVEYTKRVYTRRFMAIRYFGAVSTRKIRVLSEYRERIVRKCPECEADVCRYVIGNGVRTLLEKVMYYKESPLLVRSQNYRHVYTDYLKFKNDLDAEGMSILDYAIANPLVATPETMGLQPLTADGSREARAARRGKFIRYVWVPEWKAYRIETMTKKEAKKKGLLEDIDYLKNIDAPEIVKAEREYMSKEWNVGGLRGKYDLNVWGF